MPLCVFQHLYPNWISPDGLPTGLDHDSTRLTTYKGPHKPLYGPLCGPIIWQPGGPGAQPCKVNTYWYVLGLPSCKRLEVVKMNCAITVIQPDTKPPSPAPVPTATVAKPTAAPAAAKPIKSTDDLMKEFPDQFTGIGRSPASTQSNCVLMSILSNMSPGNTPSPYIQRSKEHLDKREHMGVITHVDQPMDWVLSITYVQKANGELHLCLDPCYLNETICP